MYSITRDTQTLLNEQHLAHGGTLAWETEHNCGQVVKTTKPRLERLEILPFCIQSDHEKRKPITVNRHLRLTAQRPVIQVYGLEARPRGGSHKRVYTEFGTLGMPLYSPL